MQVLKGRQPGPRRIVLYGEHGVGKSTWAAGAPKPIFVNLEDGLRDIECDKTPLLKSIHDVMGALSWFITDGTEYHTVVFDTADWLESLIHQQVARDAGKTVISDIGFGKGYDAAGKHWRDILNSCEHLQRIGKGIVFLAHAKVTRFEDPEQPGYDRYELDLHKSSNGMIQEWADEVLFATFRTFTRKEDAGFGKERTIAIGGKERYIRTVKTAAAVAKNRLNLPEELPMDWAEYAKYIPSRKPQAANIEGLVVDGSSKVSV
jgi:hypothetical protein